MVSQYYIDLFQSLSFPECAESIDRKTEFGTTNPDLSLTLRYSILENAIEPVHPVWTLDPHFHHPLVTNASSVTRFSLLTGIIPLKQYIEFSLSRQILKIMDIFRGFMRTLTRTTF
jgi:hypothetical protein